LGGIPSGSYSIREGEGGLRREFDDGPSHGPDIPSVGLWSAARGVPASFVPRRVLVPVAYTYRPDIGRPRECGQ